MANEISDIPDAMRKTYRSLERWRGAHTGRLPIPERLWAAAVELARKHGVAATAKVLRLEYGKLKRKTVASSSRVPGGIHAATEASRRPGSRSQPPAFVELIAPPPGSAMACHVELEGRRGKMKIDFQGVAKTELAALIRALWGSVA